MRIVSCCNGKRTFVQASELQLGRCWFRTVAFENPVEESKPDLRENKNAVQLAMSLAKTEDGV